jgi:hypothetical protein
MDAGPSTHISAVGRVDPVIPENGETAYAQFLIE